MFIFAIELDIRISDGGNRIRPTMNHTIPVPVNFREQQFMLLVFDNEVIEQHVIPHTTGSIPVIIRCIEGPVIRIWELTIPVAFNPDTSPKPRTFKFVIRNPVEG